MQKEIIDIIPSEVSKTLSIRGMIAKPIEKIKLQHRAEKYEYKEDPGGIAYIRKTVHPGSIVFDIGAHKAGYLHFFLEQLGATGKIVAFEPQTILYKYLLQLRQLFSWNNVRIESLAVSDSTGKAMLCIPYNSGKTSSPCATIIESRMDFQYQSKEEVPTSSLDDYCHEHDIYPDFLKVDVEGNELSVFKGAKELLQIHKPKILFECEARFVGKEKVLETIQFLQDMGYLGYFIDGVSVYPIALFNISHHQDENSGHYCNNFIFE